MQSSISLEKLTEGRSDRPVLLCVPGAMCPPFIFTEMARQAGCEAYGLPWLESAGPWDISSMALQVSSVARHFPNAVMLGHSIGVPIVALAALDLQACGHRLAGIVLSNSGPNTDGHGDIDRIIDQVTYQWGPALWNQFVQRCIGTPVQDDVLRRLCEYPSRLDPNSVAQAIASQKDIDLAPVLPALSGTSVAVVHGRMDKARSELHARQLADPIKGATLHILETGHSSVMEDPQSFARIVLELRKY